MNRIFYRKTALWEEIDAVWEIYKDDLHMFSDWSVKLSGHADLNDKYKLYDLFRWTLITTRKDWLGAYTERGKLIGLSYLTHFEPIHPIPYPEDFATEWEWENAIKWEACYHGSVHPSYRTPKYTDEMMQYSMDWFAQKHDLTQLFTFIRSDNRLAQRAATRNGFEYVKLLENYRYHNGKGVHYLLYALNCQRAR